MVIEWRLCSRKTHMACISETVRCFILFLGFAKDGNRHRSGHQACFPERCGNRLSPPSFQAIGVPNIFQHESWRSLNSGRLAIVFSGTEEAIKKGCPWEQLSFTRRGPRHLGEIHTRAILCRGVIDAFYMAPNINILKILIAVTCLYRYYIRRVDYHVQLKLIRHTRNWDVTAAEWDVHFQVPP